jgi:competence ComEA-like helix-hairpin-helix protein
MDTKTSNLVVPAVPAGKVPSSWPKSAQWAAAFLVGGLIVLLGIHALAGMSSSARQSRLLVADGPIYRLDLNRARKAELVQIPGIGDQLADRILSHRTARGPFCSVLDLRQVSGIGPKTFERIRPWVCVEAEVPHVGMAAITAEAKRTGQANGRESKGKKELLLAGRKININEASAGELQLLPHIGPVLSQRIVEERANKPFQSVDELRGRVKGIGPKILARIKPYISAK